MATASAQNAPDFNGNLSFLRFLLLVKSDEKVRDVLSGLDFSLVDAYPGLNDQERRALKAFNWKGMELSIVPDDLLNFDPTVANGSFAAAKEACERSVAREAVERKCYKL